ncbi:hypothetical protein I7I51_06052 [Histoplasma capsulatum]|uniref:Uncharacterized protein n=1 Tax=Ajellomyces capsulatus TaxID=5037 RepID=A0A8A1MJA1_AJECA|nr:hypothetical protein I7I51_06052 [Histoplasma capsulatum]
MASMWKPRCQRGHARITLVKWRNISARFTEPQVRTVQRWPWHPCLEGRRYRRALHIVDMDSEFQLAKRQVGTSPQRPRTWNCFQGFSGDFVLPPSALIHVALVIRALLVRPYGVGWLGYSEETLSCYLVKRGKRKCVETNSNDI